VLGYITVLSVRQLDTSSKKQESILVIKSAEIIKLFAKK
jgi:hypothetical protein